MSANPRVLIAGTPVDLCSPSDFVELTTAWAAQDERATVFPINAHAVNLCAKDKAFADAVGRADLNFPDGQSVIWAASFRRHAHGGRVPLTHMTAAMCAAWAAARLRVYLLGGQPGVAERAATKLAETYGLSVVGVRDGYFNGADDEVVRDINASGAQILLVGLGNPKQEIWADAHRDALTPPVVMACGGWLDWTAGERRPCPPWIYRLSMEWAYRLAQEPRRLFGRYVVGNPSFVLRVLRSGKRDRLAMAHIPRPRVAGATPPAGLIPTQATASTHATGSTQVSAPAVSEA